MDSKKKHIIENRLAYIEAAQKFGICKAAEIFNINRKTISFWLKKFNEKGIEGLQNKSRKGQTHPSKMPKSIADKIIKCKEQNPDWSAKKIKEELDLPYTLKIIIKKFQDAFHLQNKKNKNVTYGNYDFSFYCFKIMDKNRKEGYIHLCESLKSESIFLGFSKLNDLVSISTFINYFLILLKPGKRTVNFFISSNNEFLRLSKSDILKNRVKSSKFCIIHSAQLKSKTKESFKRTFDYKEFNPADIFLKQIIYNFSVNNTLKESVFTIPPLDIDQYSKNQKYGKNDGIEVIAGYNIFILINPAKVKLGENQLLNIKDKINNLYKSNFSYSVKILAFIDILELIPLPLEVKIKFLKKLKESTINFDVKIKSELMIFRLLFQSGKSDKAKKYLSEASSQASESHNYSLISEIKIEKAKIANFSGEYESSRAQYLDILLYIKKHKLDEYYKILILQLRNEYDAGNYSSVMKTCTKVIKNISKDEFTILLESEYVSLLARTCLKVRNLKKAKDAIERFEALLVNFKNSKSYLQKYNLYSAYYVEKGDYKEALINSKEFFKKIVATNEPSKVSDAYNSLGQVYWYLENFPKSLQNYLKAFKEASKISDLPKIVTLLGNIGLLYNTLKKPDLSLDYSMQQLKVALKLKHKSHICSAYNYMGLAYMEKKDYKQAKNCFLKQINYAKKIDDWRSIAFSYNNIGMINSWLGKDRATIRNFKNSLSILLVNDSRYSLNLYANIIAYYLNNANPVKATQFLDEARFFADKFKISLLNNKFVELEIKINSLNK